MSDWLDTETKALLQQVPPEKSAPPDTGTFMLVLLKKGGNTDRLLRSLTKVPGISDEKATSLISRACPLPVAILSITDALLGQFELICSDAISVFLRYEVVQYASSLYLNTLYSRLRRSDEFKRVEVSVSAVPETDLGKRFVDQFLGKEDEILHDAIHGSYMTTMMRKKARIMAHWAEKIGADVTIAN